MERILAFLDGDDPGTRSIKLRSFEGVFVAALVGEFWCRALGKWPNVPTNFLVGLVIVSLLAPLALRPATRRVGFALLACNHLAIVAFEFPAAANHSYLQIVFCLLAALLDPHLESEAELYVRSIRWVTVVVLFYSGVQKLMHGFYFHGEYLAFALGKPSYRPWLAPLLPSDEYERLVSYAAQVGDGPYRSTSPLFVFVSNLIYSLELTLPVLLFTRSLRVFAVVTTMVLMLAIEAGARELFFGLTFLNAVAVFLPGDQHRRLAPLFVAAVVLLVLVAAGWLPPMRFT